MRFYSGLSDMELGGNLGSCVSATHVSNDLPLARGKLCPAFGHKGINGLILGRLLKKLRSHFLRAALFSFRHEAQVFIGVCINGKDMPAMPPGFYISPNMLERIHGLIV